MLFTMRGTMFFTPPGIHVWPAGHAACGLAAESVVGDEDVDIVAVGGDVVAAAILTTKKALLGRTIRDRQARTAAVGVCVATSKQAVGDLVIDGVGALLDD